VPKKYISEIVSNLFLRIKINLLDQVVQPLKKEQTEYWGPLEA
jgi:uncharacterized protein (DUF3820 family)